MSCEESSPEDLIARLSYQPRPILNGMISISKPAKRSAIQHDPSSSSLGLLDMLDFQSLSRLSRISLRGQVVVQSLPAYRDLMEHAPHTPALGRTGLIDLHSATVLHATLLSEVCVSCGEYGAFLFLPTCERCCYECLHRSQSFWVIPTALAGKCFDLMLHQLKEIPVMRSVPGIYSVGHGVSRPRRLRLTSVKAAKELGIKVHVSMENIAKTLTPTATGKSQKKNSICVNGFRMRHCSHCVRIRPCCQPRRIRQTMTSVAWRPFSFPPSCQTRSLKTDFGAEGVNRHLSATDWGA